MKEKSKLVLIDGHALVHRAFHALPPTMSAKGVTTNAVYGFTSVLIKMIKDLNPDYVAAAFDLAGPTFRHKEFAEYKIHRQKAADELHAQVPIVKEVLKSFGVPVYEKQGYEADDLIGALAEKAQNSTGIQTVIMTGDLDTLQLVENDEVVVWTLKRGVTDAVIYDEKAVLKRYGLRPNQLVDYRGLKGDPSDNIPGVPGIGEKTAMALIQSFGNLENLYKTILNFKFPISKKDKEKIKAPLSEKLIQKLLENKDMAFFSKKLSIIAKDVPIDFSLDQARWRERGNVKELEEILKKYGFFSLVRRLPDIGLGETLPKEESFNLNYSNESITYLRNEKEALEIVKSVGDRVAVAMDEGDLILAVDEKTAYILPADVYLSLAPVFESEKVAKIFHGAKPIVKKLLTDGIRVNNIEFDSEVGGFLLDSESRNISFEKIYFDEIKSSAPTDSKSWPMRYFEIRKRLLARIKNLGMEGVLRDIEMPLIPVLAKMEMRGIRVDNRAISKLSSSLKKEIIKLEKKIYDMAGCEFNINSPSQLSRILFEKLGLKGKIRKTGKGALSTAASELDKLTDEHAVIPLILQYRELQKLKTTYIEPFPGFIGPDGRLHTTYNQTGAATGRLSSQDPNLQNVPIRTELGQEFRKAFTAEKGRKLVSFDYSQLELRIAAHMSGDKIMTAVFERGEDIHTRTAAEIFDVLPDKVTAAMRRKAKVLNFGILYGMGVLGFQRAAKVSREEAKGFIERYMAEFSGIAEYVEKIKSEARENGYVKTIFGRRRNILEINSKMPQLLSQAERIAVNSPIQGSAADLIKLAMIQIQELLEVTYKDSVHMLLQIHDELLFEMDPEVVNEASGNIKKIMENVYEFDVPIVADVKIGNNWAEMK
ncbi:MAG: polymerase protein [Candidatus Yanofskybacteria bacterium GW2011_GWA1_44_21]|uniref:DNA polymerase I n=2 Tax=Candidatus Yanofskyibacteriota TaxID=1752733 RepID=A0A1F8GZP6_9BACT|nr:MAG: polymerase protein [Candidatus Yanofskybacteria bacterium GW2011_GWA2_44_10]KKT50387.1 MAG: polymerase protein [Candidatus Yanofskybacteria bacterium GW2011_GWA1_44_21]KKT89980.1 MAG: polymerase protein [Candidatus Yanofskybacteria bacterium GW2011_GWB1_45_11]OGN03368.1 MAG: DNA polymerase I [Candidatus Yanofskybacteria bacterium RIFCSPHIGHO2_01_FULL_44_110b]OGN14715.1 MAG: DNA polymerase I [Candidatus Yanofskybacteria bacterium RIFCSPHIGHO2_02_FULL_44_36b]OGN18327.1 MAG: DNA polymeras